MIKQEIASVYIYTKDNSIYFVSTDTFRLSEMRFLLEDGLKDDISFIVPIKSVEKILRVLDGSSDPDISIHIDNDVIYLSTKNITVKTNNISGNFPDYKNIMPTNFETEITFLKADLANFLKKARLFSNNLNKISFTIKGKTNELPAFNYRYINDAISSIADDRVTFSFTESQANPLIVRGADDTNLTALISPLITN